MFTEYLYEVISGVTIAISIIGAFITILRYLDITNTKMSIDTIAGNITISNSNNDRELIIEDKDELVELLKSKVLNETNENILLEIKNKIQENNIYQQQLETVNRLKDELKSLNKRGNLALALGIVTALTGLVFLGYFAISITITNTTLENFFIEFLPRFSLVVLIEIFAYFFLRLYKVNLSEIKYIQNEITSVEFKYVALDMSRQDKDMSLELLQHIIKIERNFILEKVQTTIDIEKLKAEEQSSQNMLGKITDLLNGDNKKST